MKNLEKSFKLKNKTSKRLLGKTKHDKIAWISAQLSRESENCWQDNCWSKNSE